jgi:hypothetical protein
LPPKIVTANPAAALVKPRRVRPRRRALDEVELAELIDAVRATSADPALDLLVVQFHLDPELAAPERSRSAPRTSTLAAAQCGWTRRAAPANSRCHRVSSRR